MTDLHRIAIVGAGNIGFRHAQSIVKVPRSIDVDVIDPSGPSRQRAIDVFSGTTARAHEYSSVLDMSESPDIAIVATDSKARRGAIEQLLARGCRTFILEKVLFTKLQDYDAIGHALRETGSLAWVNCPRRSFPGAERLSKALDSKVINYSVTGGNWGMGCNVIHFLDEFCWLVGAQDVALGADGLDKGSVPAKRPGYVEFLGKIAGTTGQHRFEAVCRDSSPAKTMVTIKADDDEFVIGDGSIVRKNRDGASATEPYPVPLQSESTAAHLEAIMAGQSPKLPAYKDSAVLHRAVIGAFLDHLRKSTGNPAIDECPIT